VSQFVTDQIARLGSNRWVTADEETSPSPAALKSTWRTGFPKCPEPSDIARPVAASNITTRPSWAAIARNVPPGCHATSFSVAPYTYGGRRRAPAADHSRSSPFADVVAIVFVEDHATPVTGAGWTRVRTACVARS